jgi:methylmalonyl-CoA/ethylmalonyl-CoA epimerase
MATPSDHDGDARAGLVLKRVDHVGILVSDLDGAKVFLESVLGLSLKEEISVPALGRTAAFFDCGGVRLEVIEETDPVRKLENLGSAEARIEHVGVEVQDLESAVRTLEEKGVRIRPPGRVRVGGRTSVWTEPASCRGVMYQLLGPLAVGDGDYGLEGDIGERL